MRDKRYNGGRDHFEVVRELEGFSESTHVLECSVKKFTQSHDNHVSNGNNSWFVLIDQQT